MAAVLTLALLLIALAASWSVLYWRRQERQQDRLESAFLRSKLARRTGSGIQGQRYNPYCDNL